MASSEELIPALPDTLPDNFSEWDGDASSAPAPGGSDEWDSVCPSNEPPRQKKTHGEPENLDQILSMADRSRVWRSDSHAPVVATPQSELGGWKKETPPASSPAKSSAPAAKDAPGEKSKPAERPKESKMVFSPALENPRDEWPSVSEPLFAKPQKSAPTIAGDKPAAASSQSEARHTADDASAASGSPSDALANGARQSSEAADSRFREADKVLFEVFSAKSSEEEEEQGSGKNKKLMIVGGVAAAIVVPLIIVLSMGHHGTRAEAEPSIQTVSAATETQTVTGTPDQSASEPVTQAKPSAAAKTQQPTESQPSEEKAEADPSPAVSDSQVQMMKDQLDAPKKIAGDAKKQIAENAPPPASIGTASMDALAGSGAAPASFAGGVKPVVKSLKPVVISSGVATGMLIQKTPPVYPQIAKTARVSGTVELAATISKTGTIKDVHVLSGPVMLREAAVDAVRSWRYKPYELNNEPVDVETSINVVFNLAN
jgi:periplasmic protein TonB